VAYGTLRVGRDARPPPVDRYRGDARWPRVLAGMWEKRRGGRTSVTQPTSAATNRHCLAARLSPGSSPTRPGGATGSWTPRPSGQLDNQAPGRPAVSSMWPPAKWARARTAATTATRTGRARNGAPCSPPGRGEGRHRHPSLCLRRRRRIDGRPRHTRVIGARDKPAAGDLVLYGTGPAKRLDLSAHGRGGAGLARWEIDTVEGDAGPGPGGWTSVLGTAPSCPPSPTSPTVCHLRLRRSLSVPVPRAGRPVAHARDMARHPSLFLCQWPRTSGLLPARS